MSQKPEGRHTTVTASTTISGENIHQSSIMKSSHTANNTFQDEATFSNGLQNLPLTNSASSFYDIFDDATLLSVLPPAIFGNGPSDDSAFSLHAESWKHLPVDMDPISHRLS